MTAPDLGPWLWPSHMQRDAKPAALCVCGHHDAMHNIETKAKPCSLADCDCAAWRHGSDRYRFVGYVDVKR